MVIDLGRRIFEEVGIFQKGIHLSVTGIENQLEIVGTSGTMLTIDYTGLISKDGSLPPAIVYDNSTSGLGSSSVQDAIDELVLFVEESSRVLTHKSIDFSNSPYDVTETDHVIDVDTTQGEISIQLPPVAANLGRELRIKLISNSPGNNVVILPDGVETIETAPNEILMGQYSYVILVAGVTEWLKYGELIFT